MEIQHSTNCQLFFVYLFPKSNLNNEIEQKKNKLKLYFCILFLMKFRKIKEFVPKPCYVHTALETTEQKLPSLQHNIK